MEFEIDVKANVMMTEHALHDSQPDIAHHGCNDTKIESNNTS